MSRKPLRPRVTACLQRAGVFAFYLTVWAVLARLVNQELLLPSPGAVLCRLLSLLPQAAFWRTLLATLLRTPSALIWSLAFPVIMAGIRLAAISTIGIATIAATINAGGLGTILFSGLRTMNVYKIVDGTVLCAAVALVADVVLKGIEKLVTKRMSR